MVVVWSAHVEMTFDFDEQAALALVQDCNLASATQTQVEDWVEEQHMSLLQEEKVSLPLGIAVQAPTSQNAWVG